MGLGAPGPLVEDHEIEQIVDFIAEQGKPSYEMEIHQQLSKPTAVLDAAPSDEEEELIQQCIEVIRSEQKASVSKLQDFSIPRFASSRISKLHNHQAPNFALGHANLIVSFPFGPRPGIRSTNQPK